MADDPTWRPLSAELDRWKRSGRVAELWLRDDDAVQPTAALDRLLDLTGRHAIPALLAVIPAHAGEPLAARLASAPGIAVAVHGWAHENHAPDGQKKQELGPHRAAAVVLGELARAKAVIDRLFAGKAVAVLVPPWNRIDGALLPSLGETGFAALSVFGMAKPAALPIVNTHIDIIDWHGGRGGKDHGGLVRGAGGGAAPAPRGGQPRGDSACSPIISCMTRRPGFSWNGCSRRRPEIRLAAGPRSAN